MAQTSSLLLVTLLMLSPRLATADEVAWTGARSQNFLVITDRSSETVRLAVRFERLRRVFTHIWPTARIGAKRVVVIAPSGRVGLAPLLPPRWSSDDAVHPAGLMVAGLDVIYLAVPTGRVDLEPEGVSVHEYVHLLVEGNIPSAPLWLNEGLAEFFAAGRFDQSPVVFGLPHVGHLQVLRSRKWVGLEALLSATRGAPLVRDRATSAAFYAQAWALVHYLKLGDGGAHASALTAFTAKVAQGTAPLAAAREVFGSLALLERRLGAYVRAARFYDARLPLDDQSSQEMPVVPVAPWEATVSLGDFLTHVQNHDEAERVLAQASREAPDSAAVLERQALLAFDRQDTARARHLAGASLAVEPTRPLAHYLKAVALLASTSGMTAATTREAEASLRRAIASAPTLAPAFSTLGGLLAARDGASLEAFALIQRAIALDPSAIGHQVALGQVLLMSGDTVEAQRVAERARGAARTATERETVERLLAAAFRPVTP